MLTYFINQSSQSTNSLLSGNVASEGWTAGMGKAMAMKASFGAVGGVMKGAKNITGKAVGGVAGAYVKDHGKGAKAQAQRDATQQNIADNIAKLVQNKQD